MKPVFFAPTDIQPGELSAELQKRLEASRHLVVICSPASARSEWVAKEIRFFYELGRDKNIHLFIIDGEPNSLNPDRNCFNPVLAELGIPELLGANIHEKVSRWPWVNRERAYVQLITKLLDVEFDSIWQRHRRLMIVQTATVIAGIIMSVCTAFAIRSHSLPVNIPVIIEELSYNNKNLPQMENAIVNIHLQDEVKTCEVETFNHTGILHNIPRQYIGKPVRFTVTCNDYLPLDTTIVLQKDVKLGIKRDSGYYGHIRFKLWKSGSKMSGHKVWIEDMEAVTDEEGYVSLNIPLEKQQSSYTIRADVPLLDSVFVMPSGKKRVIEVKL